MARARPAASRPRRPGRRRSAAAPGAPRSASGAAAAAGRGRWPPAPAAGGRPRRTARREAAEPGGAARGPDQRQHRGSAAKAVKIGCRVEDHGAAFCRRWSEAVRRSGGTSRRSSAAAGSSISPQQGGELRHAAPRPCSGGRSSALAQSRPICRPARRDRPAARVSDQGAREAERARDPARQRPGPADPGAVGQRKGGSARRGHAAFHARETADVTEAFPPRVNPAFSPLRACLRREAPRWRRAWTSRRSDLFALADSGSPGSSSGRRLLAHNIANANTPGWQAARPQPFAAALSRAGGRGAGADAAEPPGRHLRRRAASRRRAERPSERAPDGNAVSSSRSS